MANKITSKNLQYDSRTPKFLAALQARASGDSGSPDPLLASRRRPGLRKADGDDAAEDMPLVVDEAGNVLEARVLGDGTVQEGGDGLKSEAEPLAPSKASDQATTTTNPARKRKTPKVIGADDDQDNNKSDTTKKASHKAAAKAGKSKPKAKKIKLSFDDDQGS